MRSLMTMMIPGTRLSDDANADDAIAERVDAIARAKRTSRHKRAPCQAQNFAHLHPARSCAIASSRARVGTFVELKALGSVGTRASARANACDKALSCAWIGDGRIVIGTKDHALFDVEVARRMRRDGDLVKARKVRFLGLTSREREDAGERATIRRESEMMMSSSVVTTELGETSSLRGFACEKRMGGAHAITVSPTLEAVCASGGPGHDVCAFRFADDSSSFARRESAAHDDGESTWSNLVPYCALRGHKDVVYGAEFVSRDRVATASRDGSVKIFVVPPPSSEESFVYDIAYARGTGYPNTSGPSTRVRGVKYVRDVSSPCLACVTTGAHIVQMDHETLACARSWWLRGYIETSCIATNGSTVVAGSRTHIGFCDFRTSTLYDSVPLLDANSARSLSFRGHTLTVGGGRGTIRFFDDRMRRWLDVPNGAPGQLKVLSHASPCAPFNDTNLLRDDDVWQLLIPAILAHAWDENHTRLFVCGGPLQAVLQGCFAGLWM